MSLLPKATLYLQLRAHELSVLHVESGHEFRDVPQLAILQQAGGIESYIIFVNFNNRFTEIAQYHSL